MSDSEMLRIHDLDQIVQSTKIRNAPNLALKSVVVHCLVQPPVLMPN